MFETERIDEQTYKYTEKLCGNIRRLLIAFLNTAKENAKMIKNTYYTYFRIDGDSYAQKSYRFAI